MDLQESYCMVEYMMTSSSIAILALFFALKLAQNLHIRESAYYLWKSCWICWKNSINNPLTHFLSFRIILNLKYICYFVWAHTKVIFINQITITPAKGVKPFGKDFFILSSLSDPFLQYLSCNVWSRIFVPSPAS